MTTELTRKEYVKQQRKKLFSNPSKFFKEEYLDDFVKGIRENPLLNILSFLKWVLIYFVILSIISFVSFEYITCDGNKLEYNGNFYDVYPIFKQDLNNNKIFYNSTVIKQPKIVCLYDSDKLYSHIKTAYSLITE